MDNIIVGTRGSKLSLIQTQQVLDGIAGLFPGVKTELRAIKTEGDIKKEERLSEMAGKGVFVKEIEQHLVEGRIDIAVHSLKDMTTRIDPRLRIAAVLKRANPLDVLISKDNVRLDALKNGAKVGTGSMRRRNQLVHYRHDLVVDNIRGNIETRIAKLDAGEYDAIVLAAAGVERAGLSARVAEQLSPGIMLPAPGQGAIAVETRASDVRTNEMVGRLNDPATMAAVTVERTVLARIGGGCEVPLGILANASADGLHVDASMTGADGKCFRYSYDGSASDPTEAGLRITEEILMSDAREIVGMGSPSSGLCGKVVMVTREEEPWGGLYEMLMQKGAVPVYFPTIQIRAPDRIPELESAMERIDTYDIVAVASRRGAEALARAAGNEAGRATGRARVVAVGDETKKALEAHGISVTYVPREAAAETLAEGITDVDSRRVLAIGSDRSDWAIAEILGRRGAIVDRITAYTVGVPKVSQARIAEVLGYKYDFVTFASPSAAHGLRETLGDKMGALMAASRAVCIGETTASACTRLGIGVAGIAERHGLAGMLEAMEKLSREG